MASSSAVRVETLTPESEDAYRAFIAERERSLFYHTLGFRDFTRRLLGCDDHYLVAFQDGAVTGVCPVMSMDGPAGRVYNSLPYFGSNGGIEAESPTAFEALRDAYAELTSGDGALAATMVANPLRGGSVEGLEFDHQDERIGQISSLPAEGDRRESIFAAVDGSARRNVRKAEQEGVTSRLDNGAVEALRRLHQENMAAIGGTAKTDEFFRIFTDVFEADRDYRIYVGERDGTVVAALLLFYHGSTVEYFIPASDHDHRSAQPLAPLLLDAMTDAAERGFRWWNWGGTWKEQVGVYRFKRKWGAEDHVYRYYTRLRNAAILDWAPEEIVAAYPGFFVVPFSALRSDA